MARQMPSYSSLGVDVEAAPASGGLLDDSTTHTAPLRRALRSLPSFAQLLRNALPTRAELNAADAPDISVAELQAQLSDFAELCALLDLYSERNGGVTCALALLKDDGDTLKLRAKQLDWDKEEPPLTAESAAAQLLSARREALLSAAARALQSAGCPVWRLEFNLETLSRGIGLPGTDVAAFPSFVLLTFRGLTGARQTLYTKTARGLNMAKLDDVDELCRRLASFGTDSAAPVSVRKSRSREARMRVKEAAMAARGEVAARLEACRQRYPPGEDARLARDLLDFASTGPGFFHFSSSAAVADAEEEEVWAAMAAGESLHGSGGYDSGGSVHGRASLRPIARNPSLSTLGESSSLSGVELAAGPVPHAPPCALPPARRSAHRSRRATFTALALEEALRTLEKIQSEPPLYSGWMQVLAMAISSGGCAIVFFDGGWREALGAGFLGGFVGVFGAYASTHGRWLRAFEFLSALCVAALARGIDTLVSPICLDPVILSALIWLVQGWTLTNAVLEIATANPLMGTSHLASGMVTTALMGFGLDVGSGLAGGLLRRNDPSPQAADFEGGACNPSRRLNQALYAPLFVPVCLSFSLLLNARKSQLVSMTAFGLLAYILSTLLSLSTALAPLSSFLSALAVGVAGNALANATGRPAIAATSSGVFILVPGCTALRSLTHSLGAGGGATGAALTARVLQVAVSIGAGLFVASLAVPHREVLVLKRLKGTGGYHRRSLPPVGL